MQFLIGLVILWLFLSYWKRQRQGAAAGEAPVSSVWDAARPGGRRTARRAAPAQPRPAPGEPAQAPSAPRESLKQKRERLQREAAKPERVYPANAQGRAEEARDKAAAAAKAKPKPADDIITLSDEELARVKTLVADLRPGMWVEDIDVLTGPSGGAITRDSLSSSGKWAGGKRPCTVAWAKSGDLTGTLTSIVFPAGVAEPEALAGHDTPEALLAAIPGARQAYVMQSDEREGRVKIDLPPEDPEYVTRVHFVKGRFTGTEYRLTGLAKRIDAMMQERDETQRAEEAAKQAKRDAWAALPLDAKLAMIRKPRLAKEAELGVDGALHDWARGYSAWGESVNRWGSFAQWLITKATPDDRHMLVDGVNWDHGTAIFLWIVQQPDTDIATVAKIMWQAGAAYHLRELSRPDGTSYANHVGLDTLDLVEEAARRVREGFYVPREGHAPIAFSGPPVPVGVSDDPKLRAAEDRLLPPILRGPIAGRPEVEVQGRLPKQFWNIVN